VIGSESHFACAIMDTFRALHCSGLNPVALCFVTPLHKQQLRLFKPAQALDRRSFTLQLRVIPQRLSRVIVATLTMVGSIDRSILDMQSWALISVRGRGN